MTEHAMTCDRMDEVLAGYLEDELDRRTRASVEQHLTHCLRCAALVRDLREIRQDAAELPDLAPARDLWDGIAARIEAPVISLKPDAQPVIRRTHTGRLAAAAVILMAVSSGLTYMVMRSELRAPGSPAEAATAGRDTGAAVATIPATGAPRSALPVAGEAVPAAVTYDREITSLRNLLDLRRGDLDPMTLAVVENSLTTIDRAIADARAALARDTASTFLLDQLNKALDKKLDLLRTVALLPPRA
jgi:hypothetical protein